jgi:hypothetical protein
MTTQTRDDRARELTRMPKRELVRLCTTGIRRPNGQTTTVEGAHPVSSWSKDDLISTILGIEHPLDGAL